MAGFVGVPFKPTLKKCIFPWVSLANPPGIGFFGANGSCGPLFSRACVKKDGSKLKTLHNHNDACPFEKSPKILQITWE